MKVTGFKNIKNAINNLILPYILGEVAMYKKVDNSKSPPGIDVNYILHI